MPLFPSLGRSRHRAPSSSSQYDDRYAMQYENEEPTRTPQWRHGTPRKQRPQGTVRLRFSPMLLLVLTWPRALLLLSGKKSSLITHLGHRRMQLLGRGNISNNSNSSSNNTTLWAQDSQPRSIRPQLLLMKPTMNFTPTLAVTVLFLSFNGLIPPTPHLRRCTTDTCPG